MAEGKRQAAIRLHGAEMRHQALDLRKKGKSFRAIASELGVTVGMAFKHYQNALAEARAVSEQEATEHRTLDLERMDAQLEALWPAAMAGDTQANGVLLRILERRSKLLGLDAPDKLAPTTPDGAAPYPSGGGPLAAMSDDELRAYIAQLTGSGAAGAADAE